ncbi:hypothetical protein KSP40_PGU017018 [Platanthera guangdongensis]|uniref:Uncharacterized protein n=1 Tax=Platanthera guangdongensis TaxID=2320717 RepID=A0ABR2MXZ2_9ASPA
MADFSVEFARFKEFVELRNSRTTTLPDIYRTGSTATAANQAIAEEEEIPTIDFSLLLSDNPHQRAKIIKDILVACKQ